MIYFVIWDIKFGVLGNDYRFLNNLNFLERIYEWMLILIGSCVY